MLVCAGDEINVIVMPSLDMRLTTLLLSGSHAQRSSNETTDAGQLSTLASTPGVKLLTTSVPGAMDLYTSLVC